MTSKYIQIIPPGATYSEFQLAAELFGLTNWDEGVIIKEGAICRLIGKPIKHPQPSISKNWIYAVEDIDSKLQYIIGRETFKYLTYDKVLQYKLERL